MISRTFLLCSNSTWNFQMNQWFRPLVANDDSPSAPPAADDLKSTRGSALLQILVYFFHTLLQSGSGVRPSQFLPPVPPVPLRNSGVSECGTGHWVTLWQMPCNESRSLCLIRLWLGFSYHSRKEDEKKKFKPGSVARRSVEPHAYKWKYSRLWVLLLWHSNQSNTKYMWNLLVLNPGCNTSSYYMYM